VVFWMPELAQYVDSAGSLAELPPAESGRLAVDITLDDRRVGAIVYDASLLADPELVRSAGRVVAIAVEHDRLTAELLASQEMLRQSRARIVQASDRERRRIAQNLHDGLQVELVLLALQTQAIESDRSRSAPTRDAATQLRRGIEEAAQELRQLVHAVMPPPLMERGLSAATEDLVDRMPVPTNLDIGGVADGTLPAGVESAAYFVVAEGLANAVKHAQAHKLGVRLCQSADRLTIEVTDDGIGGTTFVAGTGLRGLADRVDALGGSLRIDSPPGHGTHLVAELPCAS
jgi:signal transduction histidine kinase